MKGLVCRNQDICAPKKVWELVNPQVEEEYLEEHIRKPRRPERNTLGAVTNPLIESGETIWIYTNLTMLNRSNRARH